VTVFSCSDFSEAISVTAEAKKLFTMDDLLTRGRQLIRESIQAGVTAMRAHVEVDTTVRFTCLEAAIALKEEFKDICDVQIAGWIPSSSLSIS
jgi:cytosine/adenosine deaminase-related metal-dependent hydrolase